MALPTPETVFPGILTIDRAIAVLDAAQAALQNSVSSADGNFSATANGDVSLADVTLTQAVFDAGDPIALATGAIAVCSQALATANTNTSAAATAAAATYSLPGLPALGSPPPTDSGFDLTVGAALGIAPAVAAAVRQATFEGSNSFVRAQVSGALELVVLQLFTPLPGSKDALESAFVDAVNTAIIKAKNLFDPTARAVVDAATVPGVPARTDLRPSALFVVENVATLRPSDELLRARLVSLGFDVEVRKAPSSTTADANGRTLILISESISSGDVGTKFTNSTVPLIACEPAILDDLKMTGTNASPGPDFGTELHETQLQITGGHPLAAGLSGLVTVTTAQGTYTWGNPSSSAIKVAGIVGKTNEWGIFGYDTGASMVGMNAPARRVCFFPNADVPATFNDNGWALFDAAVRWATAAKALLTVGNATLVAADAAMKARLESVHRLEVLVRVGTDTKTSDLADLRVHIISDSIANPADVGTRFLSSPAPTVVCEAFLFDDMKMTGTSQGTDYGVSSANTEKDLVVAAPGHALAAGLTGQVTVVTSLQKFGWGKPGTEGLKVATLVGQPNEAGILAYDAGANMVGLRAPAPRIGFFAEIPVSAVFTPAGQSFFDATIRWARRPRAMLVVGAIPLSAGDETLRARLEQAFGFVVDVRLGSDAIDLIGASKRLIVVSESAVPANVGSKLTTLAVPVLAMNPSLFDDLKLTATTQNTDFGEATGQTAIQVVKADHPLAAGLALGNVTITTAAAKFAWGKPSANAVQIARVVGSATQSVVFGYESGVAMVGANAPARRVAWLAERDTPPLLTADGLRLFDAAVFWAAGRLEVVPASANLVDLIRSAH
jgi:DNA-binding protein YbaB